ncbi:MAG TPA: hypothetical protein VK648_05780 [Gemmatimonadaceae bacterium]|nr:hypothetical protein [Gemmatimonadaceae bacterium]
MAHEPVARLDPQRFPTTRERRADDRAIDAIHADVRRYALDEHFPRIRQLLNRLDRSGRERDLRELRDVITPHVTYHEREYPFAVAPSGTFSGDFSLHARQVADQRPLSIHSSLLAGHAMAVGRSGAGKTTLAQTLAREAYDHNLSVVTIDAKDDAAYFLTAYPATLLIGPSTPIPVLEVPSWLSRAEYKRLITKVLRRTWWGGQGTDQVGGESMDVAYRTHDHPSIEDWRNSLLGLRHKGDTYNRVDRIDATAAKLAQLIDRYPGIGKTPAGSGLHLDLLCTSSMYFGFRIHTEVEDFLTTWLLELRLAHHRAQNIRALDTLTLIDESVLLLHENTITETASIAPTFPLLREFGIACLTTTNNYRSLPDAVKSNTTTHCVLAMSDAREQRAVCDTIGLDTNQREYLATKLAPGTFILKTAGEWQFPVLTKFDEVRTAKHISPNEWRAAEERTNQHARTAPPVHLAPREECESTGQPTPSQTTAPSASPPSRVAPVVENTTPPNTRKAALNKHCAAVMHDVDEHHLTLTTPCFHRCNVRLSEGDRAKTLLTNIGFLESHRVRTGAGRGKTGSALRLTPAGWAWLGRKPPKGTRGAGVQHEFVVHELARRIPRSTIETLGADLVIAYNTAEHQQLQNALQTLKAGTIALNDGDLVALECEVSAASKTAPCNVARDAGFALTIIATMAETEKLQRTFAETDRVMVVDVLRLLDTLREER